MSDDSETYGDFTSSPESKATPGKAGKSPAKGKKKEDAYDYFLKKKKMEENAGAAVSDDDDGELSESEESKMSEDPAIKKIREE